MRASSFRHDRDGCRFLVHKGTLREILGGYLALPPNEIQFELNRWGKPSVANPGGKSLHFNTSHSGGIGLIAVRRGGQVGVDVETVIPDFPWRQVAPQALDESEIQALDLEPEELQIEAFFAIWTRKEAVAKAVGLGLSLDLPRLQVPNDARLKDWSSHCVSVPQGEVAVAIIDLEPGRDHRASLALVGPPAKVLATKRTAREISSGYHTPNGCLR